MLPKDLLKKIRRIEIRTAHLVNDALAGQYHSAFRGRGMEFEEVRPYQIGDDVRTIDWNVSARFGEPYVKVFREERELTVLLVVDLSASQSFGTREQLKRDLVAELGATLAFSAIKNNDKVGLVCFTDRVEKFVPPRKGTGHVASALDHVNRMLRRRAVVFVISDFQDTGYERVLRMAKRRHDVILVSVSDPREQALPNVGLVEVTDSETGRRVVVDTASARWREAYERQGTEAVERRRRAFRQAKLDCIEVMTGQTYVDPLIQFFRKREARR
jgi:uncharacterized protein (DUF58 family)